MWNVIKDKKIYYDIYKWVHKFQYLVIIKLKKISFGGKKSINTLLVTCIVMIELNHYI